MMFTIIVTTELLISHLKINGRQLHCR